jgi:hypothetical protein
MDIARRGRLIEQRQSAVSQGRLNITTAFFIVHLLHDDMIQNQFLLPGLNDAFYPVP